MICVHVSQNQLCCVFMFKHLILQQNMCLSRSVKTEGCTRCCNDLCSCVSESAVLCIHVQTSDFTAEHVFESLCKDRRMYSML